MNYPLVKIEADGGERVLPRLAPPHKAWKSCKKHKDKLASRYDEAIGFAFPGRDGINAGPDQSQIYDSTAPIHIGEFASRVQAGVCPPYTRWASHIVGMLVSDAEERRAMLEQLEEVDEFLFDLIGSSNFQTESFELFQDLGLGTGALRLDEADASNPLLCRAVTLRSLAFCVGPDGGPDPIGESRMLTRDGILVNYPGIALPKGIEDKYLEECDTEHEVVEIWQRDWSEPKAMRWRMSVFFPGHGNAVGLEEYETGLGALPYMLVRWSKSSGEAWGRGPLLNCLPDMRVLNYAIKAMMDRSEIDLMGLWSAEDDGVFNPDTVRLEPGVIIPRMPGSRPLENVAPQSSMSLSQFLVEEHRQNIRRALFADPLGDPNKSPMKAAEVNSRMAELAKAIGASFGRIVLEFCVPFIVRAIRILKDRRLINMPEADGKEIKLLATSPLADAQRFTDIESVQMFLGSMNQAFGQEATNLKVDVDEAAVYLAERFRLPKRLLRPLEKQKEMIALMQEAAGMMGAGDGEQAPAGGEAPVEAGGGPLG